MHTSHGQSDLFGLDNRPSTIEAQWEHNHLCLLVALWIISTWEPAKELQHDIRKITLENIVSVKVTSVFETQVQFY